MSVTPTRESDKCVCILSNGEICGQNLISKISKENGKCRKHLKPPSIRKPIYLDSNKNRPEASHVQRKLDFNPEKKISLTIEIIVPSEQSPALVDQLEKFGINILQLHGGRNKYLRLSVNSI